LPNLRTTITELGTGLGMLGYVDVDTALRAQPTEMVSVSPETWALLTEVRSGGAYDAEFGSAFANGVAFLHAPAALRERRPLCVEWKGSGRAPGDEVAPIDLRVDHVYLISCKYLSKILFNASPAHLFDGLLSGRHGRRSGDWFAEVAPAEYDELYRLVRRGSERELPDLARSLTTEERRALGRVLTTEWPEGAAAAYEALIARVALASAERWRKALAGREEQEAMFWRLLRMGSAPYFVLGAAGSHPLRLRVATPWDWRQRFGLHAFDVEPQSGGQSRVGWQATIRDKRTGASVDVVGHIEVRWSHGRFGGPPEAKVYLDSPHHAVPGYFALDQTDASLESIGTVEHADLTAEPLALFGPNASSDPAE
jgi:hypothetical protein